MIVVLTTTPNMEEAETLARKIVTEKLAACVQIIPGMRSFYIWEGAVRDDSEHLLFIKTLEIHFRALSEFIQANHSYDVPEIVAFPVEDVAESYQSWIESVLI